MAGRLLDLQELLRQDSSLQAGQYQTEVLRAGQWGQAQYLLPFAISMQMLATTEQAFTESELALWFHSSCGEIFADGVLFGVNMKAGARCSSGAGFLLAALARLAGPSVRQ